MPDGLFMALGTVISELARRGLNQRVVYEADFPVFSVAETAPSFGSVEVQTAGHED